MSTNINHPLLGKIEGWVGDGVVQFRGVQYATLEDRFASPIVRENYDGSIDARSFGPTVICPPQSCDIEQNMIQQSLPKPEYPGISDVNGLNLVISSPVGTALNAQLPVVVFIHGGGVIGGNWFPQTNFKGLVGLSAHLAKPIIGVSINYRMGPAAWMISEELKEAGYKPNRGLLDQKAAFHWLAKFIRGFGGDPNNITSMSQSAGSVMNLLHLYSTEPLFKRAIVHGGSPILFGLLPQSVAEGSYQEALKIFGLQDLSADERIEALLQIEAERLLTQIPPTIPFNPTEDEGAIRPQTFEDVEMFTENSKLLPGLHWCQQLMIGCCQLDSQVFEVIGMVQKQNIVAPFIKALEAHVTNPATLYKVLEMYEISITMTDAHALVPVLRFISEVKFCAAAHFYASAWPRDSYLYHFDEANPWRGPWQGYATHGLELAYLFQNYNEHLNAEQNNTSKAMGADMIEFAYGNSPWTSFRDQEGFQVFGNSSENIKAWTPYGSEKDGRTTRIATLRDEIGLEKCSRAIDAFLHSA